MQCMKRRLLSHLCRQGRVRFASEEKWESGRWQRVGSSLLPQKQTFFSCSKNSYGVLLVIPSVFLELAPIWPAHHCSSISSLLIKACLLQHGPSSASRGSSNPVHEYLRVLEGWQDFSPLPSGPHPGLQSLFQAWFPPSCIAVLSPTRAGRFRSVHLFMGVQAS